MFKVSIGESHFPSLREKNGYYVDKTEILYELLQKEDSKISLFTRPRRFGKTLMMSMFESFFSLRYDNRALFEGLAVTRHEEFCKEWMNQYPVIFLTLKDVAALDFEHAFALLAWEISEVCWDFPDLGKNEELGAEDRAVFERLGSRTGTVSDIQKSLKTIMRMLYTVYGKQVILLIDEYDVPLAMAKEEDTPENRYYKQMLDVIRGLISTSVKDNEYLKFAVITGCLRIAKESIFTGANNFYSYSVLDEEFSEYFGFTEEEVQDMLTAAGRAEKAQTMREWYNGYIFGDSPVYCPWDVTNYLVALRRKENARPKNYWKNTSHNGVLLTFVGRTDFQVKGKFETLMNGGTITQTVSDMLTYDSLHASEDNLWSVLVMTGYLTKADPEEEGDTVRLKIPNREVMTIFEDTVVAHFREKIDTSRQHVLMEALWGGDEAAASQAVSDLLWQTISYHDYGEDYYHAFLAGMFVGLGYEVASNKELGLGRPDLVLRDDNNRRVLLLEAKRSRSREEMEKDCREALAQIASREYAEGLDGFTQILCYGVAFFRKQALLKLQAL